MAPKNPCKIPEAQQIPGRSFGATLANSRILKRYSLVALAERLEISKQYLCDIEYSRRLVSPAQAARFAKILGRPEKEYVRAALQDQLVIAGLALTVSVQD